MKNIISCFLLMFAFSVYAEVPSYFPREVSCEQLKTDLSNYGSVKILGKFLRWTTATTYHQSVDCHFDEYEVYGVFKTSEGVKCRAGLRCERDFTDDERPERIPRCELNGTCLR